MPVESFNRPGAVDLSGLAQAAQAASTSASSLTPSSQPGGGRSWVAQGTEENFNEFAQKSVQYPVLIEFTSPRAHGAEEMSATLARLTDEAAGRWLLVRVDVDANPRLAQSIGIQAVPMLVALIGGQLAPLAQGTVDETRLREITEQVSQAAVASGMVGRAEPVTTATPAGVDQAEAGPDPRTAAAEKLVDEGRYEEALAAYDALLAAEPQDPVLKAGRAGVGVLSRVAGADPRALLTAAQEDPHDVDAQLAAADVQILGGDVKGAFDRLVDVVRRTSDEDRDRTRARLLELFDMVGTSDPQVSAARRALAAALF